MFSDSNSDDENSREFRDSKKVNLPSLRPTKDDEEQDNLFRKRAAKHLSTLLDKVLVEKPSEQVSPPKKNKHKSRVRLFRESRNFIEMKDQIDKTAIVPQQKHYNSEEDLEKCKSVSVSGEDILSQKDTKYWSKRTKAPFYKYKKSGNCLELQQVPFK